MSQVNYYGEKTGWDEDDDESRAFIIKDDFMSPENNGKIALPHSCSEWIIGDCEKAKELVKDLEKLIAELDK